jgi:hypothetical protein
MMKHSLHETVQLHMNLADWPRELEDVLKGPILYSLFPAQLFHDKKTVTYGRFVVDVRPRNLIKYDGDISNR